MVTLIAFIHVAIALLLILMVLLQDSKGGAMGALSGGSSNTVFGSTGASSFLVKFTRSLAILFAVTCVALAYLSSPSGDSVMDENLPVAAPVQEKIPALDGAKPDEAKAPAEKTEAAPSDEKTK